MTFLLLLAAASEPVDAALDWLERHQDDNGSWSHVLYYSHCGEVRCQPGTWPSMDAQSNNFSVGVTGLATLALIRAGRRDAESTRRALLYLVESQDAEGCIGSRAFEQYMYNHLAATAAISEAHAAAPAGGLEEAARRAVAFTIAAQNPGRGWRYVSGAGDNDTSVSTWAVLALTCARGAGMDVPEAAFDGAMAWYDSMVFLNDDGDSRAGYNAAEQLDVYIPGANDQYDQHPTMTAAWVFGELRIRGRWNNRLESALSAMADDRPQSESQNARDFYYWFWGTEALRVAAAENARRARRPYRQWSESVREALVELQIGGDGCDRGSWEPNDRWSCKGGRVYAVAINALTLLGASED